MLKKIVNHGGGKAITLSRVLLAAVGIDPEGELELTIDKGRITLSPPPKKQPFDAKELDGLRVCRAKN